MTSCQRKFIGMTLTYWVRALYLHRQHWKMNIKTEGLKTRRKAVCGQKRKREQNRRSKIVKEHSNENNLAVTQVDHYLLLHKCDVVEKVKLIVWKWAARAGLILNHYHHCSMADSSFRLQGVLPWCSLEQIDKLVLLLQKEEYGIKRLKTHCTLCICLLSAQGPAGKCSLCLLELVWFIGIAVKTLHVKHYGPFFFKLTVYFLLY